MRNVDKEEVVNKLYAGKEKLFSFIYEAESLLNRAILLTLLVIFLIWFNMGTIIDFLVSETKIKQNIIEKLTEATGRKAEITGGIVFNSKPEPLIIVTDVKVANDSALTNENFLEVQTIKTKPQILHAIFGHTDFDNIYFENAVLNIDVGTKDKNGIYAAINKAFAGNSKFHDKKIIFRNLEVNTYKKNPLNDKKPVVRKYSFPELELNPNPDKSGVAYEVKGSIDSRKFREAYFFNLDIKSGFGKESTYEGKIYSTTADLKLTGTMDTRQSLSFRGKIEGKFMGLAKKIFALLGSSDEFVQSLRENTVSEISGDYLFDDDKLVVNNLSGKGTVISFNLNDKTEYGDITKSSMDISVDKLDYSQMFKTRAEMLAEKKVQKIERNFKKRLEEYFLFSFGDDIDFTFSMDVPKIELFHGKEGSLHIRTILKNNQVKVSDFKAKLPGDSVLSFVGVAEVNKEEKKLKGAARVIFAGKNMDELNLALNMDSVAKQESRFGPFYIDAKGFLYGQNIHFRDIVARVNDDKFAGQMLIDYSKDLHASAAFNFTSLNIDKYLTSDAEQNNVDFGIVKEENPLSSKFDFLRVIDSVFDELEVSLIADDLVKAGHDYKDVSVFAQISPGITEVRDIYFNSDILGEVTGKAHLDLTDFQPKLDVDLNLEKYDLDLLMYGEEVRANDQYNFDGKWSTEKVSFEKLGNFVGKLNLKIGELKIFHFVLKNFVLSSHAEGNKFSIEDSRANLFGNKIDFRGYLTTEYPSFSLSFVASDLDSDEFMADTFNMNQITSTFNMSGVISSTGYSIEQMIQNLKGNVSIATKGFTVTGFDLTAVGKALPVVKRREYIKLITDELLTKGETDFSFFTGGFAIDNGQIIFTNVPFAGPNVSQMVVNGVIDLPKWQFNLTSDMLVKASDGNQFVLRGHTTGNIPNISTQWDDKGMTKYWEDKFFGGAR